MTSAELDLSCVDVVEFLAKLGIESRIENGEARFSCPYPAHGMGDKNPSAYMNLDTTAFICFSCSNAGNAITFLADVLEVSRATAKEWIAQKWAPHYANIEDLPGFLEQYFAKKEEQREVVRWEPLLEGEYEQRIVDWEEEAYNVSKGMVTPAGYLLRRGFDPLTLNLWDFCYDSISDRPCITVRAKDGALVGFKGRAWREDQWPKYFVLGDTDENPRYGFKPYDASKHVFGINQVDSYESNLVIIEGELNVVSAHSKGITNAVGPSGSTFSDSFIEQVVAMCDSVTLLLDTDPVTEKSRMTARIKVLKAISQFAKYLPVKVCEDHEGDPAEMEADELRRLVDDAKPSTLFVVEHQLQNFELHTTPSSVL